MKSGLMVAIAISACVGQAYGQQLIFETAPADPLDAFQLCASKDQTRRYAASENHDVTEVSGDEWRIEASNITLAFAEGTLVSVLRESPSSFEEFTKVATRKQFSSGTTAPKIQFFSAPTMGLGQLSIIDVSFVVPGNRRVFYKASELANTFSLLSFHSSVNNCANKTPPE